MTDTLQRLTAPARPRLASADVQARRPRLGRDFIRAVADVLQATDIAAVVASGLMADLVYRWSRRFEFQSDYLGIVLIAGALTPIVFGYNQAYDRRGQRLSADIVGKGVLSCIVLFASIAIIGFFMKAELEVSRVWVAIWLGFAVALVVGTRVCALVGLARLERTGRLREVVAVVGATDLARFVVDHLLAEASHPVEIVGVFEDRRGRKADALPVTGSIDDLIELGKTRGVNHVIIALPWSAEARLSAILCRLKALAVDVSVCPDETALSILRKPVGDLGGMPTFRLAERPLRRWAQAVKQVEDWVLGGLLLALVAPLMAVVAVMIRLESPGPVFFRQPRHGYNNREITVLKFRTMRLDAADQTGGRQTRRGDARVTRVGRWLRPTSIDELPQLINVVRGEMSLVGPRPHPVGMRTENMLGAEIVETYTHRHRVKPGLTGWAQINGYRGATEDVAALMRRVEYDLDYIERWSVLFDLRIILMTPFRLLTMKNAF